MAVALVSDSAVFFWMLIKQGYCHSDRDLDRDRESHSHGLSVLIRVMITLTAISGTRTRHVIYPGKFTSETDRQTVRQTDRDLA